MPQPPHPGLHTQIRDLISSSFSLEEFRTLCADLGVSYDDLPGEGLSARMRELILRLDREQRLDDLLNFCAHLRPKLTWPDLAVKPVTLDAALVQPALPQRNPRLIFISHARQDAEFAHQLADDLIARGWDIWIAPDSIRPGEKWVDAINRGLAESGILLLALTPYAVNSTWVHSESNVAIGLQHQEALRFIPLDVAPVASPPPLWQAYQWIPFRNSYKDGLERLMQELQPEQMTQLAGWYRQMQQAMGRNDWPLAQKLGEQIKASYPDYRETEERVALARREAEREQANQAEAARLYSRLKTAVGNNDWANALTLADQIDQLMTNYRDVAQLRERARRGQRQQKNQQRQSQWQALQGQLHRISRWGLSGGAVALLVILCLGAVVLLSQIIGNNADKTPTPSRTRPIVNITPTPAQPTTVTPTQESSGTPEVTDTPSATMSSEPTLTATPTPSRAITLTATPTLNPNIPPPNPQLHTTWIRPIDGMVMVYVPGGTFAMGSDPAVDDDAQSDEQPQHDVTVTGFWIDRTEVTNSQFAVFATETGYTTTAEIEGGGYNYVDSSWQYVDGANWQQPQGSGSNINDLGEHPVVLVSWDDANAYCTWAGGQLPTEAQWEYAARGNDGYLYPWGNTFDGTRANFCDADCTLSHRDTSVSDGYERTAPVGSFTLAGGDSWVDAADMAGNVWEWVADWYDSEYYDTSPSEDPTGPASGTYKVLRGGSWGDVPIVLRVAYRHDVNPDSRFVLIGFRCAVPPGN